MTRQFTNDISAKADLGKGEETSLLEEFRNIWKDILSGALPITEVLSFVWWRLTGK